MFNSLLVRYAEIGIKGKNRSRFENKLISNIKDCLNKNKVLYENIEKVRGRIIIKTKEDCSCLKNVFGISSISQAVKVKANLNNINKTALKLYKNGMFRVTSKRLTKELKLTSQELNERVGEFIIKNKKAKVNLKNPDVEIGIEIIVEDAYLFNKKIKGLNGLPVGIEGKSTLILENNGGILAGFLMLKRGCSLEIINKKNIDYKILEKFSYGNKILEVREQSEDSNVIIVSDIFENLRERKYNLPIFRPLIGYDKNKIKKLIKL